MQTAFAFAALLISLCCDAAYAQQASGSGPRGSDEQNLNLPSPVQPSISSSVPELGDPKKALLAHGVNFEVDYVQNAFGNPTGGVQQGTTYQSALYMVVDADLGRLAGLDGASSSLRIPNTRAVIPSLTRVPDLDPLSVQRVPEFRE